MVLLQVSQVAYFKTSPSNLVVSPLAGHSVSMNIHKTIYILCMYIILQHVDQLIINSQSQCCILIEHMQHPLAWFLCTSTSWSNSAGQFYYLCLHARSTLLSIPHTSRVPWHVNLKISVKQLISSHQLKVGHTTQLCGQPLINMLTLNIQCGASFQTPNTLICAHSQPPPSPPTQQL